MVNNRNEDVVFRGDPEKGGAKGSLLCQGKRAAKLGKHALASKAFASILGGSGKVL